MEDGEQPKAAIQIWDKRRKVSTGKYESKDSWLFAKNKVNGFRPKDK